MINVILHGCNGKMGRAIAEIIKNTNDMQVVAGIDNTIDENESFPTFLSVADCNIKGDVIIDFSHHSAVSGLLTYAANVKTPIVIATTALGDEEYAAIKTASSKIAVFNSFNMSLGINSIAKIMGALVPALEKDFNIEIIEKHHNMKKDSPSGTALLLADAINDACLEKKEYIYGRHGKSDECRITDLGIHSVRGGTIPGEHTIIFAGPDEVIEITHTALSRNIFARGAINAARFIILQKNGLFSMKDIV